jgi:hypothetical protein
MLPPIVWAIEFERSTCRPLCNAQYKFPMIAGSGLIGKRLRDLLLRDLWSSIVAV